MTTKNQIISALKETLPGQKSHYKMLPPNRVLKATPKDKHKVKSSSVLVLLFEENNNLMICLIKRPSHMKHHAGQIALPGGKIEDGESISETALRETFEEIGVEANSIEILGQLSDFYVEVSRFQIFPVIGWLNNKADFVLNPNEVEKLIFFPIKNFSEPFHEIELETLTGKLNVPCIKYNDEIIWGATAMILSEFSDLITNTNNREH